jgi:SAM-dependent methyltransferase
MSVAEEVGGMDERAVPAQGLFGAQPTYVYGRNIDDRQRLQYQFGVLREDFNLWFDETLRLGGLSTDPERADWSVLDVGCGEGQFTREIARRYPNSTVVGVDVDAAAIDNASASVTGDSNVRFLVHDARQPLADGVAPEGGFDVVAMWMVLLYLPDKSSVLANLAAKLAPGGVLMLGYVPDQSLRMDHPAAKRIMSAGQLALEKLRLLGLENEIGPLLERAGFDHAATVMLRYPIGGATSHGQRWYGYAMASFNAGRHFFVDVPGLIDGAEFDRLVESIAATSVLDLSGEVRFLVTLAQRG